MVGAKKKRLILTQRSQRHGRSRRIFPEILAEVDSIRPINNATFGTHSKTIVEVVVPPFTNTKMNFLDHEEQRLFDN